MGRKSHLVPPGSGGFEWRLPPKQLHLAEPGPGDAPGIWNCVLGDATGGAPGRISLRKARSCRPQLAEPVKLQSVLPTATGKEKDLQAPSTFAFWCWEQWVAGSSPHGRCKGSS